MNTDELYVTHYCHQSCVPFMNIFRLPKEETFLLAYKMAANNPNDTSFSRFSNSRFEKH